MKKFRGTYDVVLDAKGRIVLPSAIRKILPENFDGLFSVNVGLDSCISVYMQETWNPIADRIDNMPDMDPQVRKFKRIANSAIEVEIDGSDRILLPKKLIEHASLKKEVVVAGQGKYFEVWDKDTYEKHVNEDRSSENYNEIALTVFKNYGDPFKDPINE